MAYGTLKVDKIEYSDGTNPDKDVDVADLVDAAPLSSPAFTGTPTAPTAGSSTNTTQIATTEYVTTAVAGVDLSAKADLDSPDLTGVPTAPTAAATVNSTQLATTAYVQTGYLQLDPASGGGQTLTSDLQLDNAKKFILSETNANGTHYLSFKAPDSVTATVDFTLPDGDGSANQVLKTDGSSALSWATVGDAILANDQTWTGVQSGSIHDATNDATSAGASWAINFADGNNQKVTLNAANLLTVQPTGQTPGQSGSIFITQPSTPLNLGWHGDWKWAGGTQPSLTQTGGATDRLDYVILAANTIHAVLTADVK